MTDSLAFIAVLLHDENPDRDRAIHMPHAADEPPMRLRLPTEFEGAAAFDVYELADASQWPEQAVFRHVATVPRTTSDIRPALPAD